MVHGESADGRVFTGFSQHSTSDGFIGTEATQGMIPSEGIVERAGSWLHSIVQNRDAMDISEVRESLRKELLEYLPPRKWEGIDVTRKKLLLSIVRMVQLSEGVESRQMSELLKLAPELDQIWTLTMMQKGPANITPSVLRLISEAVPRRAKMRKYHQEHIDFMRKFIRELETAGYVYHNLSPVYVVKKPTGGYRMTIDLRYVNSQLQPVAGVMPIMDAVLKRLSESNFFSTLNCYKEYWQFPCLKSHKSI
jgi:hypothetical protein